jgi:hypothetical protein
VTEIRPIAAGTRAAWLVAELRDDPSWVFTLPPAAAEAMVAAIRRAHRPSQPLIAYRQEDFDLGAALPVLRAAFAETLDGRGMALVRGLPRAALSETEFELLTWATGLHCGVARPQGKATHYLSAVRDAGTVYRSGTGRGYSSNAELDFHTDGADVVALTCYNTARAGGMSMVSSSIAAHNIMVAERPDLAVLLHGTFHFSRQAEQAPDEGPFYPHPIFAVAGGRGPLACGRFCCAPAAARSASSPPLSWWWLLPSAVESGGSSRVPGPSTCSVNASPRPSRPSSAAASTLPSSMPRWSGSTALPPWRSPASRSATPVARWWWRHHRPTSASTLPRWPSATSCRARSPSSVWPLP